MTVPILMGNTDGCPLKSFVEVLLPLDCFSLFAVSNIIQQPAEANLFLTFSFIEHMGNCQEDVPCFSAVTGLKVGLPNTDAVSGVKFIQPMPKGSPMFLRYKNGEWLSKEAIESNIEEVRGSLIIFPNHTLIIS